jgi:hypothetical protein
MSEPHRARRGHDFWPPAEVLEAIPALYATEDVAERDKIVHLHYFVGGCDWWVVELDSIERPQLAFGYVCLGDPQMAEWGYIPSTSWPRSFGRRCSSSNVTFTGRPGRPARQSGTCHEWP